MIWEIDGVRVGHWTDPVARTGCTAVLFDPPVLASGEVRGGAPATHEFSLLAPESTVGSVDAVVMAGGSAFGLAASVGATQWCELHGRGLPTRGGRVPIVIGMGIFDLVVGDGSVRPGVAEGVAACEAAATGSGSDRGDALGAVGVGCGATFGKWRGPGTAIPGGLVGAVARDGDLVVAALVAVNARGDVRGAGRDGEPWPDLRTAQRSGAEGSGVEGSGVEGTGAEGTGAFTNTTIGVVVTNARMDKMGCHHVARGAHDGLARAITPPHTHADGDAFVAATTARVDAPLELVRAHTVEVVDRAIRSVADLATGSGAGAEAGAVVEGAPDDPAEGDAPQRR